MDIKSIFGNINKDFISSKAEELKDKDFSKVIDEAEKIQKMASKEGPLQKFLNDIRLLLAMVRDYYTGAYRDIPIKSIAAIAFTLLYVLNPIDLIPDFIPGIGQIDDAAVVALCLKMVHDDIKKYNDTKTL
jgi:uncharacterized membrane protein YkvA (DUF1232 family)